MMALPHIWQRFSLKVQQRLSAMSSCGSFEEQTRRNMALICPQVMSSPHYLKFHWLVDPLDGTIIDSRYHLFGPTALIAAAEGACEWVAGKTYDVASEISADQLDRILRDTKGRFALPPECGHFLNMAVDVIISGCQICAEKIDLPLAPRSTPLPTFDDDRPKSAPLANWTELGKKEQLKLIEEILDREIRPYIAMDEGGVQVIDLHDNAISIIYQGACVGCHSATGATLASMQAIVRAQLHPELIIIPKL